MTLDRDMQINRRTARQVPPVDDIGISPWPVDMVEFGADAYAHRKQVDVKQLYNQKPQMAWISRVPVAVSSSQFQFSSSCSLSQLGQDASVRNSSQTEGLRLPVAHGWAAQPEWERSAAMVRKTLGQYVAVCPRLHLTSHT